MAVRLHKLFVTEGSTAVVEAIRQVYPDLFVWYADGKEVKADKAKVMRVRQGLIKANRLYLDVFATFDSAFPDINLIVDDRNLP